MKTNKSFAKRLKVTKGGKKGGKILSRAPGFNHFNARQSGQQRLAGRKSNTFNIKPKALSHLLPGN